MYPDSKTIRRRRAVLGLLIVCCIVLLTASFGGAGSGPLGSIQRGVFEVVSPIQDGASRALSPVRNAFGWIGDTWNAKGDNASLRRQRDDLRAQNARLRSTVRDDADLRKAAGLGAKWGMDQLDPVTARISGASPTLFQQSVNINKGSSSGIRVGQPVTGQGALVGKVGQVAGGYAQFVALTDQDFEVAAITSRGTTGTIKAANGNPRDLEMQFTAGGPPVHVGDTVTTKGTDRRANAKPSLYPPGIPIGRVWHIDDVGTDTQLVHVRPDVNPRDLTYVEVVTNVPSGDHS